MRLAAIRSGATTRVVRIDDDVATVLPFDTLDALLVQPDWAALAVGATGDTIDASGLDHAPLVARPDKVVCVGLNYRSHILEMDRPLPEYPTLFAKFASSLIGAEDPVALPVASAQVDYEAELAIVIGRPARRVTRDDALEAVAGLTVLNDVSMRDWQWRTTEWLQGKAFERSTPIGPHLVTLDELDDPDALDLECRLNDELVQAANTSDLVFGIRDLVAYISGFTTLLPGDVIATGTPGGVGWARRPQRFLTPGDIVTTTIRGVGSCVNACVAEAA
jgi:acylpyruvate hydrolase